MARQKEEQDRRPLGGERRACSVGSAGGTGFLDGAAIKGKRFSV